MRIFRRWRRATGEHAAPVLILYGRVDCHLCDVAKRDIAALRATVRFTVEERDVDDDPEWAAAYGDQVPVGFIGARKVFKYRVDRKALHRALLSGR